MSPKSHRRADTYEGPQMNFKFPSDEDLQTQNISKDDKIELTGPKIEPYYKYEKSITSNASKTHSLNTLDPAQNSQKNTIRATGTIPEHSQPENSAFLTTESYQHKNQLSNFSSAYTSNPSTTNDMQLSIPTEDNITYQITNRSSASVLMGSPSRQTSLRRNNSSLYKKASLRRSKAVKYKVGWLTRLKQMGINIKKKLKSWRRISLKKAFNTTGRRFTKSSLNKKKISMPLERGRAKSISELKREINDWYVPQTVQSPNDTFEIPPVPQQRIASGSSNTSSVFKRTPPPLPPHRIASSPMLKAHIEADQKKQRGLNRSFSTPYGAEPLQDQPKVHPYLLKPEVKSEHPYQRLASTEDFANPHISGVIYDEDEEFEEDYYQTKEHEDHVRDLWRGYLRRTIAARIESKLEIHKISQIPEAEDAQEYAETVFGLQSDNESIESVSDFDSGDDESLTSVSGSEFSYSSGSQLMSEASTNYFSTYSGPVGSPPPIELSRESYNLFQAQLQNVKRSSTLPNQRNNSTLANARAMAATHSRFLSVMT